MARAHRLTAALIALDRLSADRWAVVSVAADGFAAVLAPHPASDMIARSTGARVGDREARRLACFVVMRSRSVLAAHGSRTGR